MPPFMRTAFSNLHLVESLCLRCGTTVGTSADPDALHAAESNHACALKRLAATVAGKLIVLGETGTKRVA